MAKAMKITCEYCGAIATPGVSFCDDCGRPSRWISHEERTAWEVAQWRTLGAKAATSEAKPAASDATPAVSDGTSEPSKAERPARSRIPMFSRRRRAAESAAAKAEDAPSNQPEPKQAVLATVGSASTAATTPPKTAPAPAAKPAVEPMLAAEPAPAQTPLLEMVDQSLNGQPAVLVAVRMLNARVAELDAEVQRLDKELKAGRSQREETTTG